MNFHDGNSGNYWDGENCMKKWENLDCVRIFFRYQCVRGVKNFEIFGCFATVSKHDRNLI